MGIVIYTVLCSSLFRSNYHCRLLGDSSYLVIIAKCLVLA